ncbi:hypothetical protein ACC698_38930, partial [Rhizobium johnstonii]
GYMRKTDLLAIERAIADAMGDISRLNGELNESEAEIAKFRQEAVIAVNSNKQAASRICSRTLSRSVSAVSSASSAAC